MKLIDQKLLKFLIVGVINTIFGCGIMFVLYNLFNVSYWISSACNYILGGILSFFLNKHFTFQNKQKSIKQILLFIIILVICYLIAYIGAKKIIYLLLQNKSESIKGNVSLCLGMILYTGLNYLGQRVIVFNEKPKMEESEKCK